MAMVDMDVCKSDFLRANRADTPLLVVHRKQGLDSQAVCPSAPEQRRSIVVFLVVSGVASHAAALVKLLAILILPGLTGYSPRPTNPARLGEIPLTPV